MAKDNFQWMAPFKLIFRAGSAADVGGLIKERGLKKTFIITDKGVVNAGALTPVEDSLKAAGIDYVIFDGVIANPTEATVEEGLAVYREAKADNIVAVGGGSAMDAGKGIGLVITNGGKAVDYDFVTGKSFPPKNRMPYFIAIPTTAGTGSEATAAAVITIVEKEYKTSIYGDVVFPDVSILDPMLSIGLPPAVTAATGMDALTHAMEC
jgi:alcohol dehydrogenase class IV